MSLLREPFDSKRAQHDRAVDEGQHYKVVRQSVQRIGHGSLACPECDLPLLPGGRMAISTLIACPFCGEARAARRFLRLGDIDTPRNQVHLIARLPI